MKRFTLSIQVSLILILCMVVLFTSGMAVMRSLQASHLEQLYSRTQQLARQALKEIEDRIESSKQTTYDIIVSDTTQNCVSAYWDASDSSAGRVALLSWVDGITNSIATYLKNNPDILCADYIDPEGSIKVVASRNYMRLSSEQAKQLSDMAVAEEGGTILVNGEEVGMSQDTLLILKQLREKRQLSMRHTGVVVLFLDVNEICSAFTETWDGLFLLQGDSIRLVIGEGPEQLIREDHFERGYSLAEYNKIQYFVLNISGKQFRNCIAALPYNPIFATAKQLLARHTVFYALCGDICSGAYGSCCSDVGLRKVSKASAHDLGGTVGGDPGVYRHWAQQRRQRAV